MATKAKSAKTAKKEPAKQATRKSAPAKSTREAAKAPAKAAAKVAPKTTAKPTTKTAAKTTAKPAPRVVPASTGGAVQAGATAPPAMPRPPSPRPAPTVTEHDVAAAAQYLLNRSASRSEEPIVVEGKRLPTEEQLLKMRDDMYMNEDQLAFFKHRLQTMEKELRANADETTEHLRETVIVPDPADRATIEEEHALELRARDRERKLLKKVQAALRRIDEGEYGFCEETGDPIGIPLLLARPTATLSLEAQQRRELKQKLFGD